MNRMPRVKRSSSSLKRRSKKPSFGERILEAHHRAQDQANHRTTRRRVRMSRQAAISGSVDYDEYDEFHFPPLKRFLSWLMAFALMPLCFITIITLFQKVDEQRDFLVYFWRSSELFYFALGMILMVGWFLSGVANHLFLYLYVLGHELTHAVFVYICGGWISDMKVGLDGGYIMTNKSNLLIALSPYFVPFWSAVVLLVYFITTYFVDWKYSEWAMTFLLGGSWCFHVLWTVWMIPKDQPDLKEHGTLFSLMIIAFANLIVLALLLSGASQELRVIDFAMNWWNNLLNLSEGLVQSLPLFPS